MKHQNTSGFSIVLAMGIVLILSFTGLYLLEYMVPFSRNIKGIENASQAFYESYAGVEESVLEVYSGDIGEYHSGGLIGNQVFKYDVIASGKDIPIAGKGNSEYDADWNRISQSEPISLFVGKNRLITGGSDRVVLNLRIPDLNESGNSNDEDLLGNNDDFLIWQLSSATGSLTSASGALISEYDINESDIKLWGMNGTQLSGSDQTFEDFYGDLCDEDTQECILKISVINPLIDNSSGDIIPYLEYQIHTDTVIPLSHAYVTSQGKSYGFSKTLEVAIPQQSTNAAFDFTVLQ